MLSISAFGFLKGYFTSMNVVATLFSWPSLPFTLHVKGMLTHQYSKTTKPEGAHHVVIFT